MLLLQLNPLKILIKSKPTLVWTVNLTFSRSLRASEISTNNDVSVRSTVSERPCIKTKIFLENILHITFLTLSWCKNILATQNWNFPKMCIGQAKNVYSEVKMCIFQTQKCVFCVFLGINVYFKVKMCILRKNVT